MILRDAAALSASIGEYRQRMYELVKKKGISDPQVLKISQQLDRKIMMLQKVICDTRSV